MMSPVRFPILLLLLALVGLAVAACGNETSSSGGGRTAVVATTTQVADFARSVGLPGRILHGLWTMAQVARAQGELAGDPLALKSLSVRTLRSLRQNVASLSGGQRQTVAIARAVLWNSKLVILDEPTAALGVAQTEQVLNLVRRLAENGLGVVLITHNMNDVFQVADSIATLFLGQMAAQVRAKDVNNTQVIELITAGRSGELGLKPREAAEVGVV